MTEIAKPAAAAAASPSAEPEIHHTHRDVVGGRLRPAVFGAMDGVISNGALVAGVAGAHTSAHDVILTGMAGLLAGAFSMAVGEWTSVRSQTQLAQAEIAKERAEIQRAPRAEERELAAMFRHRGLSRELAVRVAREISEDPDEAWRAHVREELGIDPDEQPSPYVAAVSSFVTFGIGALVPVLPYLLGAHHIWISLVLIGVALLGIGATVARFTDKAAVPGAIQHLMLGGLTVAVVYGVGNAIGTGVSG